MGPTTGAWETKPHIAAADVRGPLRRGRRLSPWKGWRGGEWEYIFRPSLWHKTLATLWQCGTQRARGSAPRTHLPGGAGGLCRWPRASGPDSPGACAPARPAAPRWPEDLPAVPPFRPPEPACESATELRDGHRPSPFTTLPAYFVTSLLSTIIHSPQYWYPMHLSKIGTFPLTLAYHILMWFI